MIRINYNKKRYQMSRAQLKEALIVQLNEIEDDKLLKLIYDMLKVYDSQNRDDAIMGYDAQGNAKTVGEVKKSLAAELKSAKEGNHISVEQLKSRSEQWLKGMK